MSTIGADSLCKLDICFGSTGLSQPAWGGRFREATDQKVVRFTESISIDRKLFEHDIQGSIAHARMLAKTGIVSETECDQIVQGLTEIQAEFAAGRFAFSPEREDVHMHIEAALIDRIGDTGRKLHTARSRNDQVSNDLRHWTRDAIDRVEARNRELQSAWLGFAERHAGVIIPGYTHMQRAQPVLAAHYALAYVEKLERDRARLRDCRKRVNVLALGAAALAGTSLPIDRDFVARELGFDAIGANSLDISSDRDFVVESVFVLTLIAEHLSGWAEEWVLWTTQEFGFLTLPDSVCTGSSIMPQKKNPDVCELIRGKCARVVGDLTQLLVLIKGLPLAYNRDLQEDKRPLFDAFETVEACLELAAVVVEGANLKVEHIRKTLDKGFLDATTLMEWLIARGVPQRTAHEVIGKLVALCEERGCGLADLGDEDFRGAHAAFEDANLREALGVENAVRAFRSEGSTAPNSVEREIMRWRRLLAEETSTDESIVCVEFMREANKRCQEIADGYAKEYQTLAGSTVPPPAFLGCCQSAVHSVLCVIDGVAMDFEHRLGITADTSAKEINGDFLHKLFIEYGPDEPSRLPSTGPPRRRNSE